MSKRKGRGNRREYTYFGVTLFRISAFTNGFSKKWENLQAAYSLWFAYYNFCRVHSTLRVTPAMESGITDHIWTIGELIARHA